MTINPIQPAPAVLAELQGKQPEPSDVDPKERREYTFQFECKDDQGKIWRGPFTNQILTLNQKNLVGVIRANITGRVPFESLDAFTREMSERVAFMTVSLIKRPDWAQDLGEIFDETIINKLYAEVMSHEATFHRRGSDQEEGKESAKDKAGGA